MRQFYIKYYNNLIEKKLLILKIFLFLLFLNFRIHKKKIGIIGLPHSQNIGNNLLKYAISIKLIEFGVEPYIIGMRFHNHNISFIKNAVKLRIIKKSFGEIKKNDYDILMVNSDQTWRNFKSKDVFDIAFLKFAKNWNIPKFVYGASLGVNKWGFNKKEENFAKYLLKNFSAISVREKSSVKLIERHLGIKPIFVLDPTLLINKKYYLKLINNFKNDIVIDNTYIFIYIVSKSKKFRRIMNNMSKNYKIYSIDITVKDQIKKFIYGIYNCKAVITDSFHGTLFSIIFNKPFISFVIKSQGNERFSSLKEVFNLTNRIIDIDSFPDFKLLEIPLHLNKTLINLLKKKSINFLKKNLL